MLCYTLSITPLSALAEQFTQAGINVGMSYEEGKAVMVRNGWTITEDKDQHADNPYEFYPEISCGSGRYAICSVGFNKNETFIALTIEKHNGMLLISGEY